MLKNLYSLIIILLVSTNFGLAATSSKPVVLNAPVIPINCAKMGAVCSASVSCCPAATSTMIVTCDMGASGATSGFCRLASGSTCALDDIVNLCEDNTICFSGSLTCESCSKATEACQLPTDCCNFQPSAINTTPQGCKNNKCSTCNIAGGFCLGNDDCCLGLSCLGNACAPCKAAGTACSNLNPTECCGQNNCQSGTGTGTGICSTCQELDGICSGSLDCCQDQNQLSCVAGKCISCIATGNACTDGTTCTNGTCTANSTPQCCQGGGHAQQICLDSECVLCGLSCQSCSAAAPCCLGYTCDAATNNCCAAKGTPCDLPSKPVMHYGCQNKFLSTGCCNGLHCGPANVCLDCIIEGEACVLSTDCCQNELALTCKDGQCYAPSFIAAETALYQTSAPPYPVAKAPLPPLPLNPCQPNPTQSISVIPSIGLDTLLPCLGNFYSIPETGITPCAAAYWSFNYRQALFTSFNMALGVAYLDMINQCDKVTQGQISEINRNLYNQMRDSLSIMEAVCYNNSANAMHPQCGYVYASASQGVVPLPSFSNPGLQVSEQLWNFVAAKAGTITPEFTLAAGESTAKIIFTAQDVIDALSVGNFNITLTNIPGGINSRLNGQTLSIADSKLKSA